MAKKQEQPKEQPKSFVEPLLEHTLQNQDENHKISHKLQETALMQAEKNKTDEQAANDAKIALHAETVKKLDEVKNAIKEKTPPNTFNDFMVGMRELLKGEVGPEGPKPVKGTDYLTEGEIKQIIDEVHARIPTPNDGTSPVKGVDYFTDQEIQDVVSGVIAAINPLEGKPGRPGKDAVVDYPFIVNEVLKRLPEVKNIKEKISPVRDVEITGQDILQKLRELPKGQRFSYKDLEDTPTIFRNDGTKMPAGGGTGYLREITDVAITSPTNGQTLIYQSSSGKWVNQTGSGTGTVTSVSVATANGFAGTVATATTTPAITITTTVTGILKGNGTSVSAAVAGTDYLTPTGAAAIYVPYSGATADLDLGSFGLAATLVEIGGRMEFASTVANQLQIFDANVGTVKGILDVHLLTTSDKTFTFPNLSGTFALSTNNLSVFASTTSAQLAGVISDETGTGKLVFGTSPTIINPLLFADPSADLTFSGPTILKVAGTNITIGQICYEYLNTMTVADNTSAATCYNGVNLYIATATVTTGNSALFGIIGIWRDDSKNYSPQSIGVGGLYLGTSGAVINAPPSSTGNVVQVVGGVTGAVSGGDNHSHMFMFNPARVNTVVL